LCHRLHIIAKLSFLGTSCRSLVTKRLCKQYSSLSEAEEDLKIDYVFAEECSNRNSESTPNLKAPDRSQLESLSPIFQCSPLKQTTSSIGDSVLNFVDAFKHCMSTRLKKQLVNYLFKLMIIDNWGIDFYSFVKSDFLDISLNAMYTLKCASKFNLLYSMSKCFFKSNQDSQPRMPLNKMPFGLIDYNIRFFAFPKKAN
jgi:hypothetical protein